MFKKISYLASVSVLASVIMGTASYAVHEEELGEIITRFNGHPKALKSAEEKAAPKEEDTSWWGYATSIGAVLKPAAKGLGKAVRWSGEQLRGDTVIGDILAEKGLGVVSQYGGSSTTAILDKVGEKESNSTSARQTCGNAVRWIGACLVDETPTLERALRQYWIDKREADDPDQAMTSTACALYLNKKDVEGVEGVKTAYRKFVKAWNSDSWTVHSTDAEKIHESFVKGLIRGFVKDKKNVNSFGEMGAYLKAFGIDYENLPITKKITAESVAEKSENVKDVTLRRIEQARQEAFMNFVLETYVLENNILMIDEGKPPLMIEAAPTPTPIPAPKAIVQGTSQAGEDTSKDEGKEKEEGRDIPPGENA